jgi:hypothetical protein
VEPLPAAALPAVPHVMFSVFNLALPNIVAWALVVAVVLVAARLRLPKFFEPGS